MTYLALLALFSLNFQLIKSDHTDIVLLGSTGDLAKKYLWQGLFNLYSTYSSDKQSFNFYGCGRSPENSAGEKLTTILDKNINCKKKSCVDLKNTFVNLVKYVQVASEKDFENLGQLLKNTRSSSATNNVIFYLSIPPEFYTSTAANIHKYCHPGNINFRIVFEKPFGYDVNSAIELQKNLEKYFKDQEIYRIDHYLGKSIVREILPFRALNPDIDKILNYKYVDRIEVVLKETVDCKGRLSYYNNNGVIRDVLQNHLMEVLLLVTMELEQQDNMISWNKKLELLKNIRTVRPSSVLIGQYKNYFNQSNDEMPDFKMAEFVPTFAAALLSIELPRWRGVPMILVSGKSLNERTSYARVIFKNNIFCVTNCSNSNQNPQIIFHIGHGGLQFPMILVSKHFLNVKFQPSLNPKHDLEVSDQIYGNDFSKFVSAVGIDIVDAYSVLIEDIWNGRRTSFINKDHLVHSWKVWDVILKNSAVMKPRIYENKDEENVLDFKIIGSSLEYVKILKQDQTSFSDRNNFSPNTFLGHKLVTMDLEQLYQKLAKEIVFKIFQTRTKKFHIAFSGGKSPVRLFEILAETLSGISLNHVHIWQVDERCVSHDNEESNFRHLWWSLLSLISIQYDNIHPMPVSKLGQFCDENDNGGKVYEESIRYFIPLLQFDYVLLGLGTDGHTASLFPDNPTLSSKALVELTQKSFNERRMTLTLSLINQAKEISVLVTGKEKHKILELLEDSQPDLNLPILKINPTHGHMTWFIDSDALPLN